MGVRTVRELQVLLLSFPVAGLTAASAEGPGGKGEPQTKRLTDQEIQILGNWILQGAKNS